MTGGGAVTDAELKALSQQLHIDDVNAVQGIVLNMQSTTTSGSTTDKAPLPLVDPITLLIIKDHVIKLFTINVGCFRVFRLMPSPARPPAPFWHFSTTTTRTAK